MDGERNEKNNMKYIIIDCNGLELPIIFQDIISHSSFETRHETDETGKVHRFFGSDEIVAAGEIRLYGSDEPLPNACCCENAIQVSTFGKSVGLGIPSRPEDNEVIAREIMRHYH